MKQGLPLYLRVYVSVIREIFNGTLHPGDKLPSRPEMCRRYHAGENTIKLTIRQLSENGFIETEKRKRPVVIYDLNNPETRRRWSEILQKRKSVVEDFIRTYDIVAPPILAEGARCCTPEDLNILRGMISSVSLSPLKIRELRRSLARLGEFLLNKTGNPVYWEVYRSIRPFSVLPAPLVPENKDVFYSIRKCGLTFFEEILSLSEQGRFDEIPQLKTGLLPIIQAADEEYCQYMNPVSVIENEITAKSRRQLQSESARVLLGLIHGIATGRYETALPPQKDISKEYQVSVLPVRAAYRSLNEAGIVRSGPGMGTQISWTAPQIPANVLAVRVQKYLDALRFLCAVIRPAAGYAADRKGGPIAAGHMRKLLTPLRNRLGPCCYPIVLTDFIASLTGLNCLSSIVHNLCGRLVYECLLETVSGTLPAALLEEVRAHSVAAYLALQKKQSNGFASEIGQAYDRLYAIALAAAQPVFS